MTHFFHKFHSELKNFFSHFVKTKAMKVYWSRRNALCCCCPVLLCSSLGYLILFFDNIFFSQQSCKHLKKIDTLVIWSLLTHVTSQPTTTSQQHISVLQIYFRNKAKTWHASLPQVLLLTEKFVHVSLEYTKTMRHLEAIKRKTPPSKSFCQLACVQL